MSLILASAKAIERWDRGRIEPSRALPGGTPDFAPASMESDAEGCYFGLRAFPTTPTTLPALSSRGTVQPAR